VSAKTEKQQDNKGKFKPGKSGNPKGRPVGSKHKATLAAQALLDGEAEALTRKAIDEALDGNHIALRLCLERLVPVRRERPVSLKLPSIKEVADLPHVLQVVMKAVAEGKITPGEGQALTAMLEAYRKGLETAELELRVQILEQQIKEASHESKETR
jgi:hypothetical protein